MVKIKNFTNKKNFNSKILPADIIGIVTQSSQLGVLVSSL